MGESQSRYSIVADLTSTKLSLMDFRDNLDVQLLEAEQEFKLASDNAKADKDAIDAEATKRKNVVDRQVSEKKNIVDNLTSLLATKKESYNEKIAQIDKALKSIEAISKESQSSE